MNDSDGSELNKRLQTRRDVVDSEGTTWQKMPEASLADAQTDQGLMSRSADSTAAGTQEGVPEAAASGSEGNSSQEEEAAEREQVDEALGEEDANVPAQGSNLGAQFFTFCDDDVPEEEEDVFEQAMQRNEVDGATEAASLVTSGRSSMRSLRALLLIFCGLLFTAMASWFGLRAYARYEVEQLEAKVQKLEEMHQRYVELEASIKPREPEPSATASPVQQAPPHVENADCSLTGQCKIEVLDVASSESQLVNGSLPTVKNSEIQRPDGSVTTALGQEPVKASDPNIQQAKPEIQRPDDASNTNALGQEAVKAGEPNIQQVNDTQVQRPAVASETTAPKQEVAAAMPSPTQPLVAPVAHGSDSTYPDLTCGKFLSQSSEWRSFKSLLQENLGTWSSGGGAQSNRVTQLQGVLDVAAETLAPVYFNVEECGMGRLSMTLLGIATGEAGGSVIGVDSLHSPLLTLLLDIPWRLLLQSGWPFFGLLAQLHLQSHRLDDLPTSGPPKEYFKVLSNAFADQDVSKLARSGGEFLQRNNEESWALPLLCALASQLVELDPVSPKGDEVLQQLQAVFRQVVHSVEDLQATLDSVWPLYGLIHVASKLGEARLAESKVARLPAPQKI